MHLCTKAICPTNTCVGLMCFHQPYRKLCNVQVQTKNEGNKSESATRWYRESVLCYASRFYDSLAARCIFCRHCKQDHRRWRWSNPVRTVYTWYILDFEKYFCHSQVATPIVSAHLTISLEFIELIYLAFNFMPKAPRPPFLPTTFPACVARFWVTWMCHVVKFKLNTNEVEVFPSVFLSPANHR